MSFVVTGAAGFIGHALSTRLLAQGETVLGIDNFNAYYDPTLKRARAQTLLKNKNFTMQEGDIANADQMLEVFQSFKPISVVHLAAQAGVRYSIDNPFAYAHSNLTGHLSILEAVRRTNSIEHLVYASSSSVYGDRSDDGSFCENQAVDDPVSLYAATKRSGELISTSYGKLYGMAQTGLRFFTVYGPWGRPDMAYFFFTQKILAGEPIEIYGEGQMSRDFTYIDDIIDGVLGAVANPPQPGVNNILNIGDSRPVGLMTMISILEEALGQEAKKIYRPMQPGDVTTTFADIRKLKALSGYEPKIPLEVGIPKFVEWYRSFYGQS
jgi:UDP-glucuronate 4-epimerase